MEWLKTVKDSHGSVELSSLSLASSINNKGIYLINTQTEKKVNNTTKNPDLILYTQQMSYKSASFFSFQLSLETVLKLQIPEEHDEGPQMRSYSLEDLRELQNKLMLMSGKGDQGQHEVNHFAEVCFTLFKDDW